MNIDLQFKNIRNELIDFIKKKSASPISLWCTTSDDLQLISVHGDYVTYRIKHDTELSDDVYEDTLDMFSVDTLYQIYKYIIYKEDTQNTQNLTLHVGDIKESMRNVIPLIDMYTNITNSTHDSHYTFMNTIAYKLQHLMQSDDEKLSKCLIDTTKSYLETTIREYLDNLNMTNYKL